MSKGYSLYEKVLKLRLSRPTECGVFSVKLVSIADDGSTCVRVIETGHELTAHPGEFFEGASSGPKVCNLSARAKKLGLRPYSTHSVSTAISMKRWAEPPNAANSAMTTLFNASGQRRGAAGSERST